MVNFDVYQNSRGKIRISANQKHRALIDIAERRYYLSNSYSTNIYRSLVSHRVQSSSSPVHHVIESTQATPSNFTALWKIDIFLIFLLGVLQFRLVLKTNLVDLVKKYNLHESVYPTKRRDITKPPYKKNPFYSDNTN